jgi:signal transduction histidine kinase/CheY-like chemotaxis protein
MVRPKAIGYRYRLLGYEQHFNTTAADNRRAVYTNLPAGDYRFEVWATNPDGAVATTEYDFSIATTPWLSWWAYTLYVVLSLLLVYLFIRLRTQALTKRSLLLEEQVKLRTAQLQQSKQEVEQLMSEREKLVENIYHQTRTPLQIMLGNIDGLLDGSMSVEHYSQKQTQNIHSLVNLTDRILAVTRVDEPLPQTKQSLDLSFMLNTLCLGLADVATAKGLTFDCAIDNHLQVWGVEGCLLNAIENIIGNSIKYTDKGGIRFTARREGEQILLQCVDTGIGIPQQALKEIFTRYQRADNAQDREGSGIGLSMVKEAVKDHDGTIELTSELAQGTQVTVTLPSQTASLEQADIDYQQLSAQSASDGEKPTILVVEDNLELAMFMKKLLSVHYQVMMAVNGKDGLLQARTGVPDLIISDVMMPMMDGFELTEQIRQDEICCHIPLLLITAKNDIASREKGFALGANDFINKPFKAPEMLNRVANQLALVAAVKQNVESTNQQFVTDSAGQDRLIARFLSAIEANYQDSELQIKSLCNELHVSNRQLERKVKHFLNMTPNALLNEYRLSRAAELIAAGNKPSQVYSSCGFNAHAYFSKRFKQKYGKLPSEYKNDTTDA